MNQEQQLESERGISWTLKKWPEEKKQSKNEDLENEPKMACRRRRIESNIRKRKVCWAKYHINEWTEMGLTNNELIFIHKIINDNNVNCSYLKRRCFSTYEKNAIYIFITPMANKHKI